jgi:catechol 2,3-dioxygenase-like lactoylglutathione lyase family enzyme
MASRISEICINCADPDTMAEFWSAAIGYPEIERDEMGVAIMGAPNFPSMLFVRTDDVGGPPKTGRNRLHIDLSPTDRDQNAEVGRLESLGARRIDIGQGTPSWVVMADPEGNEFCVLRRRVPPEPEPFGSYSLE